MVGKIHRFSWNQSVVPPLDTHLHKLSQNCIFSLVKIISPKGNRSQRRSFTCCISLDSTHASAMKKWGKRQMSYEYLWIQSQVSRKPCWKPGGFPLRNLRFTSFSPNHGLGPHIDIMTSPTATRARFFLNVSEWTRRTCGWWDHAEGAQKCDVPLISTAAPQTGFPALTWVSMSPLRESRCVGKQNSTNPRCMVVW